MQYIVDINDDQNSVLLQMLHDRSYWVAGIPPTTVDELLKWSIEDYIDDYKSRLRTKKGNEIYGKCKQNYRATAK